MGGVSRVLRTLYVLYSGTKHSAKFDLVLDWLRRAPRHKSAEKVRRGFLIVSKGRDQARAKVLR